MFASMGRDGQSLLHRDNGRWEGTLGSRAEESKFLSVWVQLPSASAKHTPAGAARRALGYEQEESQQKPSEGAEPPDLLCCQPVFLCWMTQTHVLPMQVMQPHTGFHPSETCRRHKRGRWEGKPGKTPLSQMFWTKTCTRSCNEDLPQLGNEAGPQVSLLQQSLKFFPYSTLWMLTSSPLP